MMHFHLGQREAAEYLVRRFHYSGRVPANVQLVGTWHLDGGLFGDGGPAVAACMFSIPSIPWSEPVIELTRLVRAEGIAVPPLTGLISTTARWLIRQGLFDLAVSYADVAQHHHGGIYQAASWNYNGLRKPRMDGLIVDGRFVHHRQAIHWWGTESPTKLAAKGIIVVPHYDEGKHLYWRALNKAGTEKAARLGLERRTYPKPAATAAAGRAAEGGAL